MEQVVETQPDSMSSRSRGGKARMESLTRAQRKALAGKAAQARWGKTKPPAKKPGRGPKLAGMYAAPAVFGKALVAAENRFAEALQERAYHANMTAILDAEIPSLVQTIAALKNSQGLQAPQVSAILPGDLALAGAGSIPAPQQPRRTRAQGGTMEVNLGDEEDEDKFLKDSMVGGGQWR